MMMSLLFNFVVLKYIFKATKMEAAKYSNFRYGEYGDCGHDEVC